MFLKFHNLFSRHCWLSFLCSTIVPFPFLLSSHYSSIPHKQIILEVLVYLELQYFRYRYSCVFWQRIISFSFAMYFVLFFVFFSSFCAYLLPIVLAVSLLFFHWLVDVILCKLSPSFLLFYWCNDVIVRYLYCYLLTELWLHI